uniref:Pre-mRNA-splicing factor 38 n=1 Tax=Cannabis sativa TaxID=3483 RepID=A0A803Q2F0_CANSA
MEIQTCGKPIDSLLEKVLCMNILSSDYFKELYRLKTYHEVIDEIYNQVDHVEPWMTGNCRGPSTAFCLLYKFFTMKLTVKQMHGLLKHTDSPYIRAVRVHVFYKSRLEFPYFFELLRLSVSDAKVGFLYLRYAADPKTLWNWFEPYVKDEEEFSPGSSGRMTTMGAYVRDLLLGQYYFDTLFPRIPVPVMRQVTANLDKMNLPSKHSGVTGDTTRHGSDDTARRPPSVKAALSVSFGQRAPHRASTRDSSPVRRTLPPPPPYDRSSTDDVRSRRSQSREYLDREHHRDRDNERDRNRDRDRERDRDRDRDRYKERERDRNKERDRERDRERYRDRDRDRDRDRVRDREREGVRESSYDYDRRSRYGEREGRKDYEKSDRDAVPYSSPQRDASKERTSASSNLAKLRNMYGDLGSQKGDDSTDRATGSSNGGEEVIRLGGSSWK